MILHALNRKRCEALSSGHSEGQAAEMLGLEYKSSGYHFEDESSPHYSILVRTFLAKRSWSRSSRR